MTNILKIRELEPELPIVFTHVPKTGGSTITSGMAWAFGDDQIAGISTAKPEKRRAFLEECKSSGKRYVYGHFRRADVAAVYERVNLIVSLRHPLDRILSLYFMMLRNKHEFAVECAKDVSGAGFLSFYEKFVTRRRQDNLICRYLCGKSNYKRAIEALQNSYCLVWDSESTDAAWDHLRRGLVAAESQALPLRRRNDAPLAAHPTDFAAGARPLNYRTFLPQESAEMVAERNRHDVRVIQWFEAQVEASATGAAAA